MSLTKSNKEYKRLAKECDKECVLGGFKHQTILVADSKGHCIRRVVPSLTRFKIISKAGATAADCDLLDEVKEHQGEEVTSCTSLVRHLRINQQKREVHKFKTPPTKTQKYASLSIGTSRRKS